MDPGTHFESLPPEILHNVVCLTPFLTTRSKWGSVSRSCRESWKECEKRNIPFYQSFFKTLITNLPEETTWNSFNCDVRRGFSGGKIIGLSFDPVNQTTSILFCFNDSSYMAEKNSSELPFADILIKPKIQIVQKIVPNRRISLQSDSKLNIVKVAVEGWSCEFPLNSKLNEMQKKSTQELLDLVREARKGHPVPHFLD